MQYWKLKPFHNPTVPGVANGMAQMYSSRCQAPFLESYCYDINLFRVFDQSPNLLRPYPSSPSVDDTHGNHPRMEMTDDGHGWSISSSILCPSNFYNYSTPLESGSVVIMRVVQGNAHFQRSYA